VLKNYANLLEHLQGVSAEFFHDKSHIVHLQKNVTGFVQAMDAVIIAAIIFYSIGRIRAWS
jgi:hypothetical protein